MGRPLRALERAAERGGQQSRRIFTSKSLSSCRIPRSCPKSHSATLWADLTTIRGAWQPERELLTTRNRSRVFSRYRRSHAGYIVSSYSRMKRAWSGELDPLEHDEFRREPVAKTVASVLGDHDLPGGTASGTMLHEVLEKVLFDSMGRAPSLEQWVRLETVAKVFDAAMARNGIARDRQAETPGGGDDLSSPHDQSSV